jgi:CTP-dependent riboflavin kinase
MQVLTGQVMSRHGLASKYLAHVRVLIADRIRLPSLVAGTLNIQLAEPYIVRPDAIIESSEYNNFEFLKLKRCLVNGMRCCIMRPHTHEVYGLPAWASVLEVMAPVRLRDYFGLHDGDSLSVEVEGGEDWWQAAGLVGNIGQNLSGVGDDEVASPNDLAPFDEGSDH